MLLNLYAGLGWAMPPVARLVLARRKARGKEHPERIDERMGYPRRKRPDGTLIWLHAASVGEANSVLPLIERILAVASDARVMVTTGTVTSAQVMEDRLPEFAYHQFVPVDCPAWVERFLDGTRPDLALWVESELWPNLVKQTARRRIPMVLINGRLSARSFQRWQRMPRSIRNLLGAFKLILAQSGANAERFQALGAARVEAPGNLKMATPALPADSDALAALQAAVGNRPVWLASSTHPGEEEIVAAAHRAVRERFNDALLVIVPRHPERGAEVAATVQQAGFAVAQRSRGENLQDETAVYVADTLGELGLFYRLAPIAFVGGSLIPHGGQNLIEPAQLDCAILHGPHVQNFAEIADLLNKASGAETADDADGLAATVVRLLEDSALCRTKAENAASVAQDRADVLERVMDHLMPFLLPLAGSETGASAEAR